MKDVAWMSQPTRLMDQTVSGVLEIRNTPYADGPDGEQGREGGSEGERERERGGEGERQTVSRGALPRSLSPSLSRPLSPSLSVYVPLPPSLPSPSLPPFSLPPSLSLPPFLPLFLFFPSRYLFRPSFSHTSLLPSLFGCLVHFNSATLLSSPFSLLNPLLSPSFLPRLSRPCCQIRIFFMVLCLSRPCRH